MLRYDARIMSCCGSLIGYTKSYYSFIHTGHVVLDLISISFSR
jgi:hypothetical protein